MAPQLEKTQCIGIEQAIQRLNADFCYFLDHRHTEELINLFTKDALYIHGSRQSRGQEQIRTLFRTRNESGTRTSRHVQTSLRIDLIDAHTARGTSVCTTFAADELPPSKHNTPHLVADFEDEYVQSADGNWRIRQRKIERIFVSPDNIGPVGST